MRKLIIFSPYFPPHTGGLESHVLEFSIHLSKSNFDITVFTTRYPYDTKEEEIICDNVRIIRYPYFDIIKNYPFPKIWSIKFWILFFRLYLTKYDFVMTRTRFFLSTLIGFLFAKCRKSPIELIHVEHGSDYVKVSSKITNLIAKIYDLLIGNLIFNYSDKVVSISKAVEFFVKKFTSKSSYLIYRGIEIENIKQISSNLYPLYSNKIKIGVLCRLYKWKGVENSIKAILSSNKNIIFYIAGTGEDYNYLKKYECEKIKFLGNLDRSNAISFLKNLDIYIHSSYPGGGLSTSLLEAMICNNVIIATPHEGANEVIEDNKNGYLISESTSVNIKDALDKVLRDKNRWLSFQKNALNSIILKFSWNKTITEYISMFDK